ncbi:ATP-binding cassette domain-containing protein [Cutibacterium namnetense]|uniref:ATP-binding cassette domain-containing protein n=1 Tax=Cutibacterium namnetense TaxID=1574624 RepID=UPI0007C6FD70|nr:ATP-binding cassette domain-containing protein [Cutibacterium namnetense]TKW73121.1 MAG: ATP-binding cassette domain-containing protein [Cutibacterium acnes]
MRLSKRSPVDTQAVEDASGVVLHARDLSAQGRQGMIFGPLDMDLAPRQLAVIHGPAGAGKSALLLALSGRFRRTKGTLIIDGIDAMAEPYRALQRTSVARIAEYVVPEDRLTLNESVAERCHLDAVNLKKAEDRIRQIEEIVGFRIDRSCEFEQLEAIERAVASVALAMLRETKVVVIDDADVMVPHIQQKLLFEMFSKLTELDDSTIIAATLDDDMAPPGSLDIELPAHKRRHAVKDLHTNEDFDGNSRDPEAPEVTQIPRKGEESVHFAAAKEANGLSDTKSDNNPLTENDRPDDSPRR